MNNLGEQLRQLRTERGLSIRQVALQAGLSKTTLVNWETNARKPRLPELEMLLKALSLSPQQCLEVLSSLNAPRAVQHLAQTTTFSLPGAPSVSGELLRALRLRRDWTQEQVAASVGVSQATVVHWERGDSWPTAPNLHALCFALGAHPQEVSALTNGIFAPGATETYPAAWENLTDDRLYAATINHILFSEEVAPLRDLHFYATEAGLWWYAHKRPMAGAILAAIYARHAYFLLMEERYQEATERARRAFRLIHDLPVELTFHSATKQIWQANWPCAVVALSEQWRHRAGRRFLGQAESIFRQFRHHVTDSAHQAWQTSLLADLVWETTGNADESFALSQEACQTAVEGGLREVEIYMRRQDQVRLLVKMGRATQARDILASFSQFKTIPFLQNTPPPTVNAALQRGRYLLMHAQVSQTAGHTSEAHDFLGEFWEVLPKWDGKVASRLRNRLTENATRLSALV